MKIQRFICSGKWVLITIVYENGEYENFIQHKDFGSMLFIYGGTTTHLIDDVSEDFYNYFEFHHKMMKRNYLEMVGEI